MYIFNKFQGDAGATGLGTTLWGPLLMLLFHLQRFKSGGLGVPCAQRWGFLHLMALDTYPPRDKELFELFDQMYMI